VPEGLIMPHYETSFGIVSVAIYIAISFADAAFI
jgi:hypothetical protein